MEVEEDGKLKSIHIDGEKWHHKTVGDWQCHCPALFPFGDPYSPSGWPGVCCIQPLASSGELEQT